MKSIRLRRFILFALGLFVMSAGVAMTKHAALGVSPISSVPNVLSIQFDNFSMGTWTIFWNIVLIIGQILVLQRDFKAYQWIQLPISFLFGFFVDFSLYFVSMIPLSNYIHQVLLLGVGIVFLSIGIAMTVIADFILNSGEAFVKAVSDRLEKRFGHVKVRFDIGCVAIAVILSIIFFNFKIVGTREGTILSALLTGFLVNIIVQMIKTPLETIFQLQDAK